MISLISTVLPSMQETLQTLERSQTKPSFAEIKKVMNEKKRTLHINLNIPPPHQERPKQSELQWNAIYIQLGSVR